MWPLGNKRKTRENVKKAQRERKASEERLAYAQHQIIEPLRQLHKELAEKNHITERLTKLIQEERDR